MKDFLSIIALLALSVAVFAQERVPVAPTKIDPKMNAEGIPTATLPKVYEWKRYPGKQWQAYPICEANCAASGCKDCAVGACKECAVKVANPQSKSSALDEVNAARAKRGLRPFICDDGLCAAAEGAATFRAKYRMAGHTQNDFAYLPPCCTASAAGCAAWREGFGACAMYENYTYAGAAVVVGADGLRYCHLFVR